MQVEGAISYPPKASVEQIHLSKARRNCVRFTVRNITLLQTERHQILATRGNNIVVIYLAQAPSRAITGHGIFRVASKRLIYTEGPPTTRTPSAPVITFTDEEFKLDITLGK